MHINKKADLTLMVHENAKRFIGDKTEYLCLGHYIDYFIQNKDNIIDTDNGFKIIFESCTLTCIYFINMEKNNFLNLIKKSSDNYPSYTTGDLSFQEAIMLGKFVIHDYEVHKQRMYDLYINLISEICDLHLLLKKYINLYLNLNILDEDIFKKYSDVDITIIKNAISTIKIILVKSQSINYNLINNHNFNNRFLVLLSFIYTAPSKLDLFDEFYKGRTSTIGKSLLLDIELK